MKIKRSISEGGRGWNLVEYMKQNGPWNKGLKGEEYKKHYDNNKPGGYGENKLKGKTYEDIYGKEKAEQHRIKRSITIKKHYDNGTATFGFPKDGTMKEKRKKQIFPKKDTYIERKIQEYLRLLGYDFFTHQYIEDIEHGYQCDISIPIQRRIPVKTILEVDGDWWHGNPKKYTNPNKLQKEQIQEDIVRTKELLNKGFRVIRIWESDVNKLSLEDFSLIILKGGK